MLGVYFPPRINRSLRAAGVSTRAQLDARLDDLTEILSDYDARFVRRELGWRPPAFELPAAGDVPAGVGGPELWTTRQVADFLQLNSRTVANWCLAGRVRAVKLGSDWRIPRAEVARLAGGRERETL